MYMKKILKIFIIVSMILSSFTFTPIVNIEYPMITSIAQAEVKTYEGIGEYIIKSDETTSFAKHQAQLEAERNIAEQVYVYVQSQTEVEKQTLSHDEIIVISEAIMKIIDVKYQILTTTDENFIVRATVKAEIDTEEIDKLMEEAESRREK